MKNADVDHEAKRPLNKLLLVGRVLTGLVALPFILSAAMKFSGGTEVVQGMEAMGLPAGILLPLGILELACVVIYLLPKTAVLGAILLTGYLGGAILTHLRVGDVFFVQPILGIVIWGSLWLREPRLRALLPLLQ